MSKRDGTDISKRDGTDKQINLILRHTEAESTYVRVP